ncbi:MAG: Na+/H+ antiporter NhaC family protein, partial [Oscillibacter sp.]
GAWGYFVIYQIAAADTVGGDLAQASKIFMQTIPFQIFPIVACIIAILFAFGLFPKIGPMKKAYTLADQGIQMGAEESGDEDDAAMIEEMVANDSRKQHVSVWNLVLPMVVIVCALFYFGFDGFKAFAVAVVVTGILFVAQGLFTIPEYVDCFIQGTKDMMDMTIILIFGYGIQSVMQTMGFESFVLDICGLIPIASLIPFIFFVYFALEEYLLSLNYTLYQILIPVLIVVLPATGANVPLTLGAIMSAALFGANTCVISDLGIIAAKSCRIKIYDQYICCQPYYWIAAAITAVAYLVLGFLL